MPENSLPLYTSLPFVALLLLIAVLPLAAPRFWEKNRKKAAVVTIVSLPMLFFLASNFPGELLHSLKEYFSFIMLLASLFIISGGILLRGDLRATPAVNTAFLAIGAVLANLIGTTGASMLLIRPVLRTNSERKHTRHIPVFFIFTVSNIGGCLTPLGDPPLFLGYLRGVPFGWTIRLFPQWLFTLAIVLAIFYLIDRHNYHREAPSDLVKDEAAYVPLGIKGGINILFVVGVILSVFFQVPLPFREMIMLAMVLLSLLFTPREARSGNKFTFGPINEVAILFAGIFVTMVPVLMMLREGGAGLGITKPWQFFWITGGVSSFLDNAPTYLTFFSLAQSVTAAIPGSSVNVISGVSEPLLRAISCGAVFMGANSYIGNGPNFMVKSIAEEQGVDIPHFFAYMFYSALILVPIFALVTVIFFRG
jgi:Na+/H+ antiporter NhaD/arsenite permease-like protein